MQRGKQWLEQLLQLAKLPATVEAELRSSSLDHSPEGESSDPATTCWLSIQSGRLSQAQTQALIGSGGHTIDAIQYLANSILNIGQEREQQIAYTIDLDGYRERRQIELQTIADQAATQARETGQEIELKSLSSAERRQIHTFLQDCPDLETYSRGQEPDRRLVVRLR